MLRIARNLAFGLFVVAFIASGPQQSTGAGFTATVAAATEWCSWQEFGGGTVNDYSDDWEGPCGFGDNSNWCFYFNDSSCPGEDECTGSLYCEDHLVAAGDWCSLVSMFPDYDTCFTIGGGCSYYVGCTI